MEPQFWYDSWEVGGSKTSFHRKDIRPYLTFSVSPPEVELYYGNNYAIEHIEKPEVPEHPLIKKWGLDFLKEHAFMLTKTRMRRIPIFYYPASLLAR
jgi:hypothetical protein